MPMNTFLRRRYIRIAPCKRSVAWGRKCLLFYQPRSGLNSYGVRGFWGILLPRASLRLHGAININPLLGKVKQNDF